MIEIFNSYTKEVIYKSRLHTIKEALMEAILKGADLRYADLSYADLSCADLSGANLNGAYLNGAYLNGANLSSACLNGADLSCADLSYADFRHTRLRGAILSELQKAIFKIVAEGDIIGYKKLRGGIIAKLLIPKGAKRVNAIGSRKCRASYARVLELSNGKEYAYDKHTGTIKYSLGELVYPDSFNDFIFEECTHGIHFFITKEEAEAY